MLASGQYGLMKHYSNHFSSSTPLYSANTVECHLKSPFLASKPQCHNHSFITYLLSYLTKVTGDPGLSLGISKPTGFASDSGYEWALARKTPKPTPCFLQAPLYLRSVWCYQCLSGLLKAWDTVSVSPSAGADARKSEYSISPITTLLTMLAGCVHSPICCSLR